MRIVVDYRPALRQRTGVGEYIHQLVRALARQGAGDITVFTSSWKDRPPPELSANLGVRVVDRRLPGVLLNLLWHRVNWPPVEWLTGPADVVHAAHPLLIPARRAAQVVTIHDLFFLDDPDATRAEIRRDYPRLAGPHARRAHAVVTSSEYGRGQIIERLHVDPGRVHVVPPGAPSWRALGASPNRPEGGYVLFVGTLEPRKNIGTLLDAWSLMVAQGGPALRLVLAGRATSAAEPWLRRMAAPPLAGTVQHLGYVADADREALYAGARVVVLPSQEEGFGLPVLEAMSAGVPVVASRRGAIPEVTAGAAALVEAADAQALASALCRVLNDDEYARDLSLRGLSRARAFTWEAAATRLLTAYVEATTLRLREQAHS